MKLTEKMKQDAYRVIDEYDNNELLKLLISKYGLKEANSLYNDIDRFNKFARKNGLPTYTIDADENCIDNLVEKCGETWEDVDVDEWISEIRGRQC